MGARKISLFEAVFWATIILWLAGAFNILPRKIKVETVNYEVIIKNNHAVIKEVPVEEEIPAGVNE